MEKYWSKDLFDICLTIQTGISLLIESGLITAAASTGEHVSVCVCESTWCVKATLGLSVLL